ncbi:MAG: ComEA family DNA-binding protein, partial [bacterium]
TLTALDGVGEATAKKIIAYRQNNGSFKTVGQLVEVHGIGDATLDKNRDKISVGDVSTKPPININSAGADKLQELDGIGPSLANEIVNDRTRSGNFETVEELTRVEGIGTITLNNIRDRIKAGSGNNTDKIDLNRAGVYKLDLLFGIGSHTAREIVEYRKSQGYFRSKEEITNVQGIGPATLEEIREDITVRNAPSSDDGININKASVSELTKLSGVGPTIAQRIVDYRQNVGEFQSTEEIKKVNGIGSVTYKTNTDLITVD